MENLIFYYPEGHQSHSEQGHPERPLRVDTIRSALQEVGWWDQFPQANPVQLPSDVLYSIHSPIYLDILKRLCERGEHYDADTYTVPASWELANKTAGGAAAVAQAVWQGQTRRGFALTRPPGHHAKHSAAMGFCLLNNIAVAAEFLIQHESVQRIAIIDLDLHHGNGTQESFYSRQDVFYFSTHQYPFYPGTGSVDEIGSGSGKGFTANFPLPRFSGDDAFRTIVGELILPLLDRYNPQIILVSYGFDPHWRDPLGNLQLSAAVYGDIIAQLTGWADLHCDGRISLFLEGGYDLLAARACSLAVIAALLGETFHDPLGFSGKPEGSAWQSMVKSAKDIWLT